MVFKKARKVIYRKAKKSYRRASSGSISPMQVLLAGAVYGAARPFAAKILPDMFSFGPVDSDNVIIGGAAAYFMPKTKGFTKALCAVAAGSEAGIVAARVTSTAANNIGDAGSDAYNY